MKDYFKRLFRRATPKEVAARELAEAELAKMAIDTLDDYGLWAEHDAVLAARANLEV